MNQNEEKMPPPEKDSMLAVICGDILHVLRVANQYRQKKKIQFFPGKFQAKRINTNLKFLEKKLVFLYDVLNHNGKMFAMFSHT